MVRLLGSSGNIVLVADTASDPDGVDVSSRRDLEKSDAETIRILIKTIETLGRRVVHYETPEELALHAPGHSDDVVLSIYGGAVSRSRMALVPAVCETFHLRYIGPDAYGRFVAQDKEVSKRLAADCGLRTPAWRIIRDKNSLPLSHALTHPCVVKPLLEGSSIGISNENLAWSSEQSCALAKRLLSAFNQPVLVEEFIAGRETSYAAIETSDGSARGYSEVYIEGSPNFFYDHLFDANEKLVRNPHRTVRNIDGELTSSDQQSLERFLRAFGRFGYCRVDGRHADGKFFFLEMTPDAWIHPLGQFAMAFTKKGWTYDAVIAAILASDTATPRSQ